MRYARVGGKMIPLSSPDNHPTVAPKFASVATSECGATLRGTDGISKFAATATHRLPIYARPSRPRVVTSIEDKLETGLGIPRIVAVTNRHPARIIRSANARNVKIAIKECMHLTLIVI